MSLDMFLSSFGAAKLKVDCKVESFGGVSIQLFRVNLVPRAYEHHAWSATIR